LREAGAIAEFGQFLRAQGKRRQRFRMQAGGDAADAKLWPAIN